MTARRNGGPVTADVMLWGVRVGAVAWDAERELGSFEYDPAFIGTPVEIAPLQMPLRPGVFVFPELNRETFKGLPGLLADSLPDKFGNRVIDAWLARQEREPSSFSPVERLCYIGRRGMGALEFEPATRNRSAHSEPVELDELVLLANEVLRERAAFSASAATDRSHAMASLLTVGTSAGGARAKAVLAWNPATHAFRSGQIDGLDGFELWLVKFDGVSNNRDHELADPMGFGRIEYAYSLMAKAALIDMAECRLFEEGGRAHFMTRRFDRPGGDDKLHMQSLCAIDHLDYNLPRVHGYEQALQVIRRIGVVDEAPALEQLFRRMVFNIAARNQDDHTKNIAFLMDRLGQWRLAPAFDLTYAFNPAGAWTSRHQMTVNGKSSGITHADLVAVATLANISKRKLARILQEIGDAMALWSTFAAQAEVPAENAKAIAATFQLDVLQG